MHLGALTGEGRVCVGRLKEIWAEFTQEVARIRISEHIAMRPMKDGQCGNTLSRSFLTQPLWQRRVVDLIREFYPQKRVEGHPYFVHAVLHSVLSCVAKLQTLWHHKAWLTDAQVEEGKSATTRLGQFGEMLGWKPTVWVHWAVAHSRFYMERYRSIYLFSSIPTEHRNSRFKVELRMCFKGWSVRRPLLNRRGLKHVEQRRVFPKTKRARM